MNKKPLRFATYTKKAVSKLLVIGAINGTMPFLLSAMGKEPCIEMGVVWVTEVVAVIIGYFIKSFKETKESEATRLKEKEIDTNTDNTEGEELG